VIEQVDLHKSMVARALFGLATGERRYPLRPTSSKRAKKICAAVTYIS
jgi:hypothetical protein